MKNDKWQMIMLRVLSADCQESKMNLPAEPSRSLAVAVVGFVVVATVSV